MLVRSPANSQKYCCTLGLISVFVHILLRASRAVGCAASESAGQVGAARPAVHTCAARCAVARCAAAQLCICTAVQLHSALCARRSLFLYAWVRLRQLLSQLFSPLLSLLLSLLFSLLFS